MHINAFSGTADKYDHTVCTVHTRSHVRAETDKYIHTFFSFSVKSMLIARACVRCVYAIAYLEIEMQVKPN